MLDKFKGLKHTQEVIEKMCSIVKANPKKIDFKKTEWFNKYSWTEHEQEEFTKWLSKYLYMNGEARRELMANPIKNNRITDGVARSFVMNYGWKLK